MARWIARQALLVTVLGLISASQVRALPLEILLHPPGSESATTPITVTLTPARQALGGAAVTKETTLGKGCSFDVPAGSVWTVSIAATALYATPRFVAMPAGPQQVALDLLPAGTIHGAVRLLPGETFPKELTVRFRSVPEAQPAFPETALGCPVKNGTFSCVLPARDLDLRFRARGYLTLYRWGTKVEPRRTLSLGTFELKPGASVVGWIEAPERGFRFADCSVELAPQTPGTGTSLGDVARRDALVQTEKVSARGFFEIAGIAPGSYRVTVKHPKYAAAHFGPVQVYAGLETEVQSIKLEPPVDFSVHLDPPLDPYGHNWSVALSQSDQSPHGFVPIKNAAASPAGVWKSEGLEPGRYLLTVDGSYRSSWWREDVEITSGMAPHEIELPVVRVSGTLTLGKEPLAALLFFGGRHGTVSIPAKSKADGRYEVDLPRQKESWPVEIVNPLVHVEGLVREVSIPTDRPSATADLKIQDTRITGLVVTENGDPVGDAEVEGMPEIYSGSRLKTTSSNPEGRFELRGLAMGSWRLEASAAGGLEAESTAVQVTEGGTPPDLKLVLRKVRKVSGQIVGPNGAGVPGARIVAVLDEGQTVLTTNIPTASTDVSGIFELTLPGRVAGASLTVFPPGFAVRQVRIGSNEGEPLVIPVDQAAGTLTIHYSGTESLAGKRRNLTSFFHEAQLAYPGFLEEWAVENGALRSADDSFVVPMLEPGTYTVCYDIGRIVGRSGRLPPGGGGSRCAQGTLAPFGELTLDLTASRDAEATSHAGATSSPP